MWLTTPRSLMTHFLRLDPSSPSSITHTKSCHFRNGCQWMRAWSHTMADMDVNNSSKANRFALVTRYGASTSSSGYMYHIEPYCGSHTLLPETGLGQGSSVIIGLAEQAQVPQGCKFFHDNLFTTLSLMDEMTKRGYGSSGTMRQNRLFDIPFTPLNAFMKLPRGTSEVLCQGEKLLVRWKDNNIVTVATNMDEKYTETSVKRWNRHRRGFDNVQQPKCISRYNEHMGGVDLHDQQVSRYHISIRSKKCFAHLCMVYQQWSCKWPSLLQRCYWRDHRPAHLLTDSLTVSSAKVWNETTEPRKEISTECYS